MSLASGNPVGDPEHWPVGYRGRGAAKSRAERVVDRRHGGRPAGGARAFEEAGLTVFEIGDEAILDLGGFSLNAPGLKPVRQAVRARLAAAATSRGMSRPAMLIAEELDRLADSCIRIARRRR